MSTQASNFENKIKKDRTKIKQLYDYKTIYHKRLNNTHFIFDDESTLIKMWCPVDKRYDYLTYDIDEMCNETLDNLNRIDKIFFRCYPEKRDKIIKEFGVSPKEFLDRDEYGDWFNEEKLYPKTTYELVKLYIASSDYLYKLLYK